MPVVEISNFIEDRLPVLERILFYELPLLAEREIAALLSSGDEKFEAKQQERALLDYCVERGDKGPLHRW